MRTSCSSQPAWAYSSTSCEFRVSKNKTGMFSSPTTPHPPPSMCTVLGHGHGHSHGGGGHGHAHMPRLRSNSLSISSLRSGQYSLDTDRRKGKRRLENINVRAAFIHAIGDLIQSIGIVIAGYVIWIWVREWLMRGCGNGRGLTTLSLYSLKPR